jgi:hypothetical protein
VQGYQIKSWKEKRIGQMSTKQKNRNKLAGHKKASQTSLDFIKGLYLSKNAKIVNVGGGYSMLIDSFITS